MKYRPGEPRPRFTPVPSVLIAFHDSSGEPQILSGGWMGIVCSRPAVLSLSMNRHYDSTALPPGGSFSVNLPREELLALPGFRDLQLTEDIGLLALFGLRLGKGIASPAPIIEGCPIRIECRRVSLAGRFGAGAVSGEVLAVHAEEKIYGLEAPVDLCRLKSFMQRARSAGLPIIPALPDAPCFQDGMIPDAG